MKKIVLTGDKKAILIISLAAIVMLVSIYFISLEFKPAFAKYGMDVNTTPFFIVGLIIEIVTFVIIMNQLITIINFDGNGIGFGLLNLRKIGYREIKKVSFNNKIELHTAGKTKHIKVIYFEKNKEKYKYILDRLNENIKKNIKPESLYGSIVQNESMKFAAQEGKKPAINGLLVFFAIYLVFVPISNISILLKPAETQNTIIMTIYYGLICVLGIITAISFFMKKPQTVNIMKIYFAIVFIGGAVASILNMLLIEGNMILISGISGAVCGVLLYLLIARYFKISQRVKATFA